MNRIAKFEKVSFEQWKKDVIDALLYHYNDTEEDEKTLRKLYDEIKLPQRATYGSAGYDFYFPLPLMVMATNTDAKIPTGIRCKMENGWVLQLYPRSGHGFKTGVHLANTVGIIDADYFEADNEGHIHVKLVNDSLLTKRIELKQGEAFCQGIFLPFGFTVDDDGDNKEIRHSGFGSTTK